jgi:hypothetical protein
VEKREEGHTHRRPGAYLVGMAGQCPRGQQDATRGRLHRSTVGSTTTALPPACSLTQRSSHRSTAGVVVEAGEASHRGCQSQQIPRGEITPISSERRRLTKPLGGGKRGRSSEYFAQGGGGEGHRSWPESTSVGGGDPVARELGGQRGRRVRGWAGSVVRPRPEPGCLSQARWASWPSRPGGLAG